MTPRPILERVLGEWAEHAACKGKDPQLFFPPTTGPAIYHKARAICKDCPVTEQCLQHAYDHGEWDGVWGGLSPTQRKVYWRARKWRR
jgi:WhiB family redox-sensing transcriptional regulator